MNELLFAYYVFGNEYQEYIPLCIYFVGKVFPKAFTIICLKRKLSHNISDILQAVPNERYRIAEDVFSNYPDGRNPGTTFRWIMQPKEYDKYNYVYIGDIDILITDERLFDDHLKICQETGLPYSTSDRVNKPRGYMFTGLHFFQSKPYLTKMRPVMNKYTPILKNGLPPHFLNRYSTNHNQRALRVMVEESGLPLPHRNGYFRYHGVHLGHSRCGDRWFNFFNTPNEEHIPYYKQFVEIAKSDNKYNFLYESASKKVREEIDIMVAAWHKARRLRK